MKTFKLTAAVAITATMTASTSLTAAHASPTEMTIVAPGDAANLDPGLYSDGRGMVSPELYIDSALPNGDACASGTVSTTGGSTFYPGVKRSDGTFCNAGLPEEQRRTYTFIFPAGGGDGPCEILLGTAGPCTVSADALDYQRVVIDSLFARRAKTTDVHIALHTPAGSFEVKTNRPADIVLDSDSNIRTAVYSGTARLYAIESSGLPSTTPATASFALPLQVRMQIAK